MYAPVSEKRAANAAINPAFAALPNQRVLAGQGRPLSTGERGHAERTYGADLGHVRVHDGPSARQSADALGAHGWSFGEHVVLGNTSRPDTLNHELAHVVQQRHAPADEHPRVGEHGGALERDAQSAAETGRPPALTAASRTVQMQTPDEHARPAAAAPQPAPAAAQPGPAPGAPTLQMPQQHVGYQPPSLGLGLQYRNTLPLSPADRFTIDNYLTQHHFTLMQLRPALDGANVTVDEIVARLMPSLGMHDRAEIERYVSGKVHSLVLDTLMHPRLTPTPPTPTQLILPVSPEPAPGPRAAPPRNQGWQTLLGAGAQIAWHIDTVTGRPAATPQDVTLQFQAARNFVGHPENQSGSELQGVVQFGYNITTHSVSVMSGAQYTEVFSLFNGLLQLAGFAQLLAGVAAGGGSVSAQIQPSVGAQAVVQVGRIQFGPQITRGVTISPGQHMTEDTGVTVGAAVSF